MYSLYGMLVIGDRIQLVDIYIKFVIKTTPDSFRFCFNYVAMENG